MEAGGDDRLLSSFCDDNNNWRCVCDGCDAENVKTDRWRGNMKSRR